MSAGFTACSHDFVFQGLRPYLQSPVTSNQHSELLPKNVVPVADIEDTSQGSPGCLSKRNQKQVNFGGKRLRYMTSNHSWKIHFVTESSPFNFTFPQIF